MRFFFYGTLVAGSANPVATAVHPLLRDLGPARITGRLHAIPDPHGWYAALTAGDGIVHGRLYEAKRAFGAAALARLDAYEDYDPTDPAGSLYLRETLPVTAEAGGDGLAQVYRLNCSLPAASELIAGGDFAAWLAQRGNRAFRP